MRRRVFTFKMQERCYGSDEEQTRTVSVDAAEQKCHTPKLQQIESGRETRKIHRFAWFTFDQGYIHGREKQRAFYYRCSIQVEASPI